MNFVVWLVLCIGLYILPAGISAFINLDWSYLDFTTWSNRARLTYVIAFIIATIVVAIDGYSIKEDI